MHPNAELITRFYEAFQRRDGAAMAACYHPEATFSDPVFQGLSGQEPGAMWRMLCHRGKDLVVVFRDVQADAEQGTAHWDATYTFSQTGRRVENHIDAAFTFKDGLIHTHVDQFDLWSWCAQAMGVAGSLFGWGPLRIPIRSGARKGLREWIAREAQG